MEAKKDILKTLISKVKMQDAGRKMGGDLCCAPKAKNDVYYPTLYLSTKEAPYLSGCDVDDEVTLLIKARVSSHSLNEHSGSKREEYSLELKKIGVVDKTSTDDKKD